MKAAVAVLLCLSLGGQQASPTPAQAAGADEIAQAADPSDCVTALQAFVSKRQQEVRPATGFTSALLKQIDEEKIALATTCIARFERSADPAMLPGLGELYVQAGLAEKARATIEAALAAQLPPAARAATLAAAITVGLRDPKSDARNARLERLIDEIDANPSATFVQQLNAHASMASYYRGDDIDAGIIKHGRWMAAAASTFTPQQRRMYGRIRLIMIGYDDANEPKLAEMIAKLIAET